MTQLHHPAASGAKADGQPAVPDPARAAAPPGSAFPGGKSRHEPLGDHSIAAVISREDLWDSIKLFAGWLDRTGYESYDPYDLWGTGYGLWARKVYYRQPLLGIPLVAPVLVTEILYPGTRRLFVGKARFATADAQLALGFLNLHYVAEEPAYLDTATALGNDLLKISVPGYSGHCWGYPFDWQNSGALWRKDTPFITATPYCFEAFLALYDVTGDGQWLDIARSVARFVSGDLKDTAITETASASSYSPIDNGTVVNASAYRAWALLEAASRFDNQAYGEQGTRNLNFVLLSQNKDGSWPYAWTPDGEGSFIDHFHTCFVLKNLYKLNRRLGRDDVDQAIRKGCDFYREHLFYPDGTPRPYAVKPRMQIVRHELYDFAEAIALGALLGDAWPEGCHTARGLAQYARNELQTGTGCFLTRAYRGRIKHRFPYIRWAQAQMFHALALLLRSL